MGSARGFTMIELVVVMILVGILAVVAIPRLDSSAFQERGFRDGVFTTITHARRLAMASRRFVCVTVVAGSGSAATVSLSRDPNTSPESAASIACSQSLALPAQISGCAADQLCAPAGVTLGDGLGGSLVIRFDPLGRSLSTPNNTVAASVAISNQTPVTVEAETGYVQ